MRSAPSRTPIGDSIMQPSLSERIVSSYLLCKTKASLELGGETGVKSEYEALAEEARAAVRSKFLNQFANESTLDGVVINRKALKVGVPAITNGLIEGDNSSYHFDMLVRRRGDSALGDFHYVPAIVYGGYSNPINARQILSLTNSKLAPLQRLAPKHGLVVNAAFERETRSVALSSQPSETKKLLLGVEAVRSQFPNLQLNSHCAICEFRTRCEATATQADDLSLLKGLAPKAIAKLQRRGIFTIFQYAHTYRARRSHSGTSGAPRQHALQAMAVRDQRLYVIGKPELPQSQTSVYLDFEGDPERGFVYLIAVLVCKDGMNQQFSFWAEAPSDEPRILGDLHRLLMTLGTFEAYCYGSYESACLKRLASSESSKVICELVLPKLTNVLNVIYRHLYLPTYSNGLKEIAASLGFQWRTPTASGALSVLWRRQWEQCGSSCLKNRLIEYNADDCAALAIVTDAVRSISSDESRMPWPHEDIERQATTFARPTWEVAKFQLSDFEFINERAYFDYQRDRIYLRAGQTRRLVKHPTKTRRFRIRPNEQMLIQLERCPHCGRRKIDGHEDNRLRKVQYDLRFSRSGIKRIVRHFKACRYSCPKCQKKFTSDRIARVKRYGHALQSWGVLHNVAHSISFRSTATLVKDGFGIPLEAPNAYALKSDLARVYEPLYQDSLQRIVEGELIHADETEIVVNGKQKAYVWVLSSMHDAVYIFRESRETAFLEELLNGFGGVLVSDFFVGYDSISCKQQRCLIHLMRDFNQSIRLAPFDAELRDLAMLFGELLRSIVAAVDEVGLKAVKLRRFKKPIATFFLRLNATIYSSEAAEGFRLRLLKNESRLFTFIDHDNVPWNNNNAEHAMKHIAWFRDENCNLHTPHSIRNHLVLMGMYVTCVYRDIPFLKFLLSRKLSFAPHSPKADDDWFDLYPPGYKKPIRKPKKPTPNPPSSSLPKFDR